MADDYLWDRAGEPDPEVARLEGLLERYRERPKKRSISWKKVLLLAAAAGIIVGISLAFILRDRQMSDWQVAGKNAAIGETIETGSKSGTTLEAVAVGQVELEPNSRLRILASNRANSHFALQRGTMHALIWAPPSRFVVETPSAKTIDLGCAYTLTVRDDDSGLLTVQAGWVAFQSGSKESFIPAGAACRTTPGLGPGLPYFESSSPGFQEALLWFERKASRERLETLVENARKEDALTLWHLIGRTSGQDRELVVHRFASLIPGTDVSGLLAGNPGAIDQAWNSLGLGKTDWWRIWERDWRATGPISR